LALAAAGEMAYVVLVLVLRVLWRMGYVTYRLHAVILLETCRTLMYACVPQQFPVAHPLSARPPLASLAVTMPANDHNPVRIPMESLSTTAHADVAHTSTAPTEQVSFVM